MIILPEKGYCIHGEDTVYKSMASMILGAAAAIAFAASVYAGGPCNGKPAAPLDASLMAFKEQGVWYDLCEAPAYLVRIPPHYATYGPPPIPCCPVPVQAPATPPVKIK
ncbi:MAG: hypothetical protein ACP5M0_15735 [Desulfomonilaceae bacterium]